VVRVAERDRLLATLAQRGIACGIHYPKPIHLQAAYAHLGLVPGSFPIAERQAEELLSLPMFPELTPDQIETVAVELKSALPAPVDSCLTK
jgi:dTDP-4-amino-4,6-dideoxygalactose transaminase